MSPKKIPSRISGRLLNTQSLPEGGVLSYSGRSKTFFPGVGGLAVPFSLPPPPLVLVSSEVCKILRCLGIFRCLVSGVSNGWVSASRILVLQQIRLQGVFNAVCFGHWLVSTEVAEQFPREGGLPGGGGDETEN